ncbi:MAG: 30S ribosomal protein S8 [Clostridia bacterium]
MQITDPIADMLTRIRNANSAKHVSVDIPASNLKKSLADILLAEGYVKNYEYIEDDKQGTIRIALKYGANKEKVITGLKRISKPGLRVFAGKEELPKVLGGLGIAIISTSNGLMTDKNARRQGIGGEVLAFIW